MKQNTLISNPLVNKYSHTDRNTRQIISNDKPIYSPRLFTRKKQKKDIPNNAFSRRKFNHEENNVLKYLSPKKMFNDDQFTFLSDDHQSDYPDRYSQKSMFDLDFSRINAQKSEENNNQLYCAQNLFDDMNCSHQASAQNSSSSILTEKGKNKNLQIEDKTGLSLETMSQSPQQKEGKKFDERLSALVRQNGKLRKQKQVFYKQNNLLKDQLQVLKLRNQQLQIYSNDKDKQIQKLHDQFQKVHEKYNVQMLRLQDQIEQSKIITRQLQIQKQEYVTMIKSLEQKLILVQKQSVHKQQQIKSLHQGIQELKNEFDDKYHYSKCLQDVILQLNQKIDQLRRENQEITCLLQQKSDQLQNIQLNIEHNNNSLHFCQIEIQNLHKNIKQLSLRNQQLSKNQIKCQCLSSISNQLNQIHDQNFIIKSLKQQILTFHSLLNLQREHNDKLKKQISYKHVQLNLLKKNHYQNQKQLKQIQILKGKNKKLMKKVNSIMQQNTQLKQKLSTQNSLNKNSKKQNSMKKFFNKQQDQSLKLTNNKDKQSINRINNHQLQSESKLSLNQKNTFRFDSDDELSFKLSPDKR